MHCSNNILLIKPANFGYNAETATSNSFQNELREPANTINQAAVLEFEQMAQKLSNKGVNILVIEDSPFPIKPDAIFPNNWGSFHSDGTVVLYPMLAKNRRAEKRKAVLDEIEKRFEIKAIIDLSEYEDKEVFLEGTGSIVFDHNSKVAYACSSPRTNKELFEETCNRLGYEPLYFFAKDSLGQEIYHTNVMMTIGVRYAIICLESITSEVERQQVDTSLKNSGKSIIEITYDQMSSFCGNMLELEIQNGKNIVAMSESAYNSLTKLQKASLEEYCELFPIDVNTIERIGGGSVRCMIAEIFLPMKLRDMSLSI